MRKNRLGPKDRRKPTGSIGPILLNPSARSAEHVPIQFPSSKSEIEFYILDRTIDAVRKSGGKLYSLVSPPIQNSEAHFDFTLQTKRGDQYLDLIEFAPLSGSYGTAPGSYRVWDFAKALFSQVERKAAKYGNDRRKVIHLLAYTTDWRFRPDDNVISLLRLWLARDRHPFETVYYYSPDDAYGGQVWKLFPARPEQLSRISEDKLRDIVVLLADFSRMQVESTGAVVVPLSAPPKRTP